MANAANEGRPAPGRPSILRQICAVRPVEVGEVAGKERLKQVLGPWQLMSIGLGATIGTGVFVLTGQVAASHSGPAVTLSFLIAAAVSTLAALCYAEFATFLPVPGSAYSYTYATLGEGIAWFIGWNLLLEYAISASAVAVSWSAYVVNLLKGWGINLPEVLIHAPYEQNPDGQLYFTHAILNVPAVLIVAAMSYVCYVGISHSARANTLMVTLKVAIILVFMVAGL